MNTAVLYLYPLDNRDTFRPFAERWVESYKRFPAGAPHRVCVCFCGGSPTISDRSLSDGLDAQFFEYWANGHDIGAQQHCASMISADLLVTGTARHYFWREGWLARMVKAWERYGEGLYAAMTSMEGCPLGTNPFPNPHIRTAFYGMAPKRFLEYPFQIDNREKGYLFESGEWNVAKWFEDVGRPVMQVAWDGVYAKDQWGQVRRGFRQGDQSNCLVFDKHTQAFAEADLDTKKLWQKRAWGI